MTLCITAFGLVACADDDSKKTVTPTEDTYTIALVLPFENNSELDIEETLAMFEKNLAAAQQGCSHRVKLNIERHDENKENLSQLASELRKREDVKAVIGPIGQEHLDQMCYQLKNGELPLMAINVGSTEVARKYISRNDFFWALTQTDISKLEIMLTSAARSGARRFDLVCANSGYTSQTYKDWFGFEVTELGLRVASNNLYTDTTQIRSMVASCFADEKLSDKAIICVPNDEAEAHIMMDELYQHYTKLPLANCPKFYFSDNIQSMNLGDLDLDDMMVYFVSPTAEPSNGFAQGFESATGYTSSSVEAQLYDALMLTSLALANNAESMTASLKQVATGEDAYSGTIVAWTPERMGEVFRQIEQGALNTHIAGASGNLYFDPDNHTCVTESCYMLGIYKYSSVYKVAYYHVNENSGSTQLLADWQWQSTQNQDFKDVTYTPSNNIPLHERWAVVVASSEGFENYRHQADALNVYQLLREQGYDDEHILLVMADDIASSPYNKRPGEVWAPDSTNLYHDLQIDYHVKDLSPEQIMDKIAQLPCDSDDNVVVFWSGHGMPGALMWGNEQISPQMVKATQDRLVGRYRKMAWFIEACYSGCIGEVLQGYDNMICMTAANANETSKAYLMVSEVGGVNISNRFSAFLISSVKNRITYSFKELYNYLCIQTIGSHVMLYNYVNYGDINQENVMEYFFQK